MALRALSRPELFTQQEVARILGLNPHNGRFTVAEVAPRLGIEWKADPARSGMQRLLARRDIVRLGRRINAVPDWAKAAIHAA